jgi:hypothetical protein
MTDGDGEDGTVGRALKRLFRSAGRQYGEATENFRRARTGAIADLPTDDEGRVRLVCRRHAERRAVALDEAARPACFDPDHRDCRGCVEDVREGCVETW